MLLFFPFLAAAKIFSVVFFFFLQFECDVPRCSLFDIYASCLLAENPRSVFWYLYYSRFSSETESICVCMYVHVCMHMNTGTHVCLRKRGRARQEKESEKCLF